MSALLYIHENLKEWHESVHGDYKVSKIVFVVNNASSFQNMDSLKYWEEDNRFFGIIYFSERRVRVCKVLSLMPEAKLYRCNNLQCRVLTRLAEINLERTSDDFLKNTYESFLNYLLSTE